MDSNGKSATPAIVIIWDAQTQGIGVSCNPSQVKTLEFARGLVKMADDELVRQIQMARAAQMQEQAAAAQQEQALRSLLGTR